MWNDEVMDAIRAKTEAKKKWETLGRQEERRLQASKQGGKETSSKIEGVGYRSWKRRSKNDRYIE